jgi:hypothetical protein
MKQLAVYIENVTRQYFETFGSLDSEQLNWKADPSSWSIAQNIDHIILLNKSYFQEFKLIELGTYTVPLVTKLKYWYSFARNPIKPYTDSHRVKKSKTYDFWNPTRDDYTPAILNEFQARQREFIKHMEQLHKFSRRTLVFYPGDRSFVFTLETAFGVMIEHERRHYNQAKEVLLKMGELQEVVKR